MLGETPAGLLPEVEEMMDAAIMTAAGHEFTFRHPLLRRAAGELIPRPARTALHRQYGEILLGRGEPAVRAASHLLQAAHPADRASLAGLDKAAAQTLCSAPRTAADLALRALELTPADDLDALSRAVAAAEALAAAGRLDQAARIAGDLLAQPLPPAGRGPGAVRPVLGPVCPRPGPGRRRPGPDGPGPAAAARQRAGPGAGRAPAGPDRAARRAGRAGGRRHPGGPGPAIQPRRRGGPARPRGHQLGQRPDLRRALGCCATPRGTGPGTSPDARQVQPLLALAAALVDLRQLGEAEDILRAADHPALENIPAQAARSLLRARIQLAAGRLAEAATDGRAALVVARTLGADGYAATAHGVLSMIQLRRGDLAAAAQHLAWPVP